MKTIVAIIEKGQDQGYSVYTEDIEGGYGSGLSEQEAKDDFREVIEEQAEYCKEKTGSYPGWHTEGYRIEYKYDFSGFFMAFPYFNVSRFAEAVGINPSLMRKYKEGLAFASEKQKTIIQNGLNEMINKLSAVQF